MNADSAEAAVHRWLWDLRKTSPTPLGDEAIEFLRSTLTEAIEERMQEAWPKSHLPADASPESVLRGEVGQTVRRIIGEASLGKSAYNRVLLIDLLDVVHRRWCTIWPFCRPEPEPEPEPEPPKIARPADGE